MIDVSELREENRQAIRASIDIAFNHREPNVARANKEMFEKQKAKIEESKKRKDGMIKLGKFSPRESMAITYDSHDYPYLLQLAWEKIQRERVDCQYHRFLKDFRTW